MDKEGYFGKKSLTPDFLNRKDANETEDDYADPTKKVKDATKTAARDKALDAASKTGGYVGTAAKALKAAEKIAEKRGNSSISNLENSPSLFTGSNSSGKSKKKKKKFSVKKALPLILIVLLFGFGGIAIFAATTLLGAHISANTSNLTNFSRTAVVETEKTLLVWLSKSNSLPKKLQQRFLDSGATAVSGSSIEFNGHTYSGDEIATAMNNDVDFAELVNSATYSNALDYHDDSANETYNHLAQNRNVFKDFDGGSSEEAYDTLRTSAAGGTANVSSVAAGEEETDAETTTTEDEDTGEETTEKKCPSGYTYDSSIGKCKKDTNISADTSIKDAEVYLRNAISNAQMAQSSGALGATACTAWRVANVISLAVSASETYSSINYFMDTMESISKTMFGQGDKAGINQTYNFFSTPTTETVVNPDGSESTVTGSPLMSEWAKTTLGGVQGNTTASKPFSFSRISSSVIFLLLQQTGILASKEIAQACNVYGITAAVFSLLEIAVGGVVSVVVSTILGLITAGVVYDTLSFLVPTIAKALFSNAYTEYENGIPGGEEFGRGATAANSRISRSASGLMPASESKSLAYQKLQAETIARDNAIDRSRRSPFDASSPNTFLGSILNKFAFTPIFNGSTMLANLTSGNLFAAASSIANATMSSLNSSVYAANDDININYYYTTYGDCPEQQNVGISGDMYCNAFEAADVSVFGLTPDDLANVSILQESIEKDTDSGNEKIKEKSELYFFVNYAADRDSPWGAYDVNIVQEACGVSWGALNHVPVFSQLLSILNNVNELGCTDLATGERYVYSEENTRWDNEIKYYQAYVSQARILDRLGYYEEQGIKSPVAVLRADYRDEHPLDNSRAGILARISGIDRNTATAILDLYDYNNFIANYNPSERYSFIKQQNPDEVFEEYLEVYIASQTETLFVKTSPTVVLYRRENQTSVRQEGITA